MHLHGCKAIPADTGSDQTTCCPNGASTPSPFCPQHAEEYRALEEREWIAAREANLLKSLVRDIVAQDADAYTQLREIEKDERVVALYLDSLEEQVDAAVALKTRFSSEAEERGSENLTTVEERMGSVVAFLIMLQERADTLGRQLRRDQEAAALPPKGPESASSTAVSNVDEARGSILEVPHPPCVCKANSSDDRALNTLGDLPERCTAVKLRDGLGCMWRRVSGQQFCRVHCAAHGIVVLSQKAKEGFLQAQRRKVVCRLGDKARRIEDVKCYIDRLEEMIAIIEEHRRLFCCTSPESHTALLQDLETRRTSAGLLLGELDRNTDGKIAEDQGQAESSATEFLAEAKNKEAIERRKAREDLLVSAIVGGALTLLGIPWARSVVGGVVTAFVVRKARDAADDA